MTRGKHAVKASKARAEAAEQKLAEVEATLRREREEWARERADLRNEVQRLQNKTRSEIDRLAAGEVAQLEERHKHEIKEIARGHYSRAAKALALLSNAHPNLPMKTFLDVSDALGVNYAEAVRDWHGKNGLNRHARRRVTNKQLNSFRTYVEDVRQAGRSDAV